MSSFVDDDTELTQEDIDFLQNAIFDDDKTELTQEDMDFLQNAIFDDDETELTQEDMDFLQSAIFDDEQETPLEYIRKKYNIEDKKLLRRIIDTKLDELSDFYKDIKQDYYKALYIHQKKIGHISNPEYKAKRREYFSRPDVVVTLKNKRHEYRKRPEIIARRREYSRNWKLKHNATNSNNRTRKNRNANIRTKVVQHLVKKFGKEEPEIERILNHRYIAGLAEPEIEVRKEYRKEYRKELRKKRRLLNKQTGNINDDDDNDDDNDGDDNDGDDGDDGDNDITSKGGKRKSAKKKRTRQGKTWQGKTWQGKTWQGKTWQGKKTRRRM